ncbi:hypothetical protein AXG93_2381s1370 [Marchantia polymorpha subsp. ruderalis]|uniref:PIH1 domain-containing protein 1 n=1 Tax=Marchantia polymorpha subsp. ruderalis TaxID=1480154 RepID=A0A176VQ65_MARPO|nr:hypothetical protein AXG93_2381s1370 [Marchantia polymorpha subsp. ruderalis]
MATAEAFDKINMTPEVSAPPQLHTTLEHSFSPPPSSSLEVYYGDPFLSLWASREVKNMTHMMKDPKFMELFADYAKEMSDPNNRKEMEDALREAENRGEKVPGFPEDKELLIPSTAFCAKTKNEKTGAKVCARAKVFINICYSDKIAKPKGTEAKDKSGTAWEIPYSLGPAQTDVDKRGAACEVHDFVVATETHHMARMDKRFKNFLVETAVDAVQTQRAVQLSRDFSLPKLTYKGPNKEPKMLTIPKGPYKSPASHPQLRAGVRVPDPVTKKPKSEKKSRPVAESRSATMTPVADNKECPNSSGEVEPKFEVVYRNHLNFTKFWDDNANLPTEHEQPTDIILRVELPKVMTMQDIELEVTEQNVRVAVPGRYILQLHLRYKVDEEKGQAKFDKSKQQLHITLPICHPPLKA